MNIKRRQEFLDCDYIHKLNEDEKDFLNSFLEEWVNANLSHDSKYKHHVTPRERSLIWRRNNNLNDDIYSVNRVSGKLRYLDDLKGREGLLLKEYFDEDSYPTENDPDNEDDPADKPLIL